MASCKVLQACAVCVFMCVVIAPGIKAISDALFVGAKCDVLIFINIPLNTAGDNKHGILVLCIIVDRFCSRHTYSLWRLVCHFFDIRFSRI